MFKYEIGQEVSPGITIVDREISQFSGSPVYYVNDFSTPFLEDEVEDIEYYASEQEEALDYDVHNFEDLLA